MLHDVSGTGENINNIAQGHAMLSRHLPFTPNVGCCLCQPFALSTPALAGGREEEHRVLSHELLALPDLGL